jgi:ribosomal protein S12 methylthiotransferase accessory factor
MSNERKLNTFISASRRPADECEEAALEPEAFARAIAPALVFSANPHGAILALTDEGEGIMKDIEVTFPGGKRVDARVGDFVLRTDQPHELGGDDSAPAPFDLFLASLATCAGIYALGFCQARNLTTEGLALRQHVELDESTHLPTRVELVLTLPRAFPEKYRAAIARAVDGCKVKKTIGAPPSFEVVIEGAAAASHEAA